MNKHWRYCSPELRHWYSHSKCYHKVTFLQEAVVLHLSTTNEQHYLSEGWPRLRLLYGSISHNNSNRALICTFHLQNFSHCTKFQPSCHISSAKFLPFCGLHEISAILSHFICKIFAILTDKFHGKFFRHSVTFHLANFSHFVKFHGDYFWHCVTFHQANFNHFVKFHWDYFWHYATFHLPSFSHFVKLHWEYFWHCVTFYLPIFCHFCQSSLRIFLVLILVSPTKF